MIKKAIYILLIIILIVPQCGCWDYRALNDLNIVAGMAVDKNDDNTYHATFEFLDLSLSSKDTGLKPKTVESDGETVFRAIRNAKRLLKDKLYFADAMVVVVSQEFVADNGIKPLLDWLLRDNEPRETMNLIISKSKTAKDILTAKGVDNRVISLTAKNIIDEDNDFVGSTHDIELYGIYDTIMSEGLSLALPAFSTLKQNEETIIESDGVAIFKEDKIIGFLSPEDSQYYLLATNDLKGGIFAINNYQNKYSLEISDSKVKRSFTNNDGKLKFTIEPEVNVSFAETGSELDIGDKEELMKLEEKAEKFVQEKMQDVIKKVQVEYNSDIFGFGNLIYQRNPKLWNELKKDWDNIFRTVEVNVQPKITIINTGLRK